MNRFTTCILSRLLGYCLLAGTFVYLMLRCSLVPIYGDEIITYFTYIQPGSFQPFVSHPDANNHVVNSLLSHLFYLLLGDHLFVLRLPNLMSFLLFGYFIIGISRFLTSRAIQWSFLATFFFCSYFLDFFVICRGYGLSLAFLTGSIYHLIKFHKTHQFRFFSYGMVFMSLAVWSNLGLLVSIISLGFIYLMIFISNFRSIHSRKQVLISLIIFTLGYCLPIFYAVKYSIFLRDKGMLYLGLSTNFYDSVIKSLLFELSFNLLPLHEAVIIGLISVTIILLIISFFRNQKGITAILLAMLVSTMVGTMLLHYLFKVNYPVERAAIQFFLLFVILFFWLLDRMEWKWLTYLSMLFPMYFILELILTFNVTHLKHWKYEQVPIKYYSYIHHNFNIDKRLPFISSSPLQKTNFLWYEYQNNGLLNNPQSDNYPNLQADYIISDDHFKDTNQQDYDVVYYDSKMDKFLLKRNKPIEWEVVFDSSRVFSETTNENCLLFSLKANQLIKKELILEIWCTASSDHFPFEWYVISEAVDSESNAVWTNAINLQYVMPDIRDKTLIRRSQWIPVLPADAAYLNIFIWNIKNKSMKVSEARVRMFSQ